MFYSIQNCRRENVCINNHQINRRINQDSNHTNSRHFSLNRRINRNGL